MTRFIGAILLGAMLVLGAQGEELLTNGDFASGSLDPWKVYTKKDLPQATGTVADGVLTISIDAATPQPHERQLIQPVAIESATKYVVSFDTKTASTGGEEIILVIARTKNFEKGHYGLYRKFAPGNEWETQKFYFTTKDVDPLDPPALKFNLGALSDDVSFRNLTLKPTP